MTSPETSVPYGFCHCGCGKETTVAIETNRRDGRVKGIPMKYLPGHNVKASRPNPAELGHFKMDGVYCRLIPLTRGQWTIVWEVDFGWISKWHWFAQYSKSKNCYYAMRRQRRTDGSWAHVSMHREMLGMSNDDPRRPDHVISENTLDNRGANLRIATKAQNSSNSRRRKDNTSGYKGVSYFAPDDTYTAEIMCKGVKYYLGRYKEKEVAHAKYCEAARRLFGEFARFE